MTHKTNDPHAADAAKLASEHGARVLADAFLLRLKTDGKTELAGKVRAMLEGELGELHSSLYPDPPSPG